ncbi:hypothetical protein JYU34_016353 [Plutella xylostella]|uniref:Rapamycin-insensitive companion of mTOR n=1 Tax=Plutella xylostella TaxID=51655 RepID=A0ABQ7Q3A1_PLUXY|nr:hypothetical protein JYU34_016353 [Plutella xylostella]
MATIENWVNRKKGKHAGNLFKLDTKTKTPEQNIIEILQGLYVKKINQSEVSPAIKPVASERRLLTTSRPVQNSSRDSFRLSYLNAWVTLLCKEDRSSLGFTNEEFMTCLRISLVDESVVIRAAALRVLRYLIKTESDVAAFNNLKIPYLVMRSMDLMLSNEEERAQALRVVRRVIAVAGLESSRRHRAAYVEPGLLRCLVAIARAGSAGDGSGDRLARPAVATLAEIGVIAPALLVSCGGINAITRFLGECATPRMAEALCGALLHTLDSPHARRIARLDLRPLCAPYCDFHFRANTSDSSRDEREMRFTCSRLALLCVLRSWPGLLHFCHPCSGGGLRAVVHALHLPRLEVRKAILELLYELLGLPQPEWTDEISVALAAVDPSDFQDSWRLSEGFVAAEGTAILPHLSATGPDITEIHLALLLQCFLEAGLLDGLAEVIVTSDTFISVRATVLLGQLLHLIHTLLPPQICNITPPLPSLIAQAAAGKPQALAAIAALKRLHTMLEARPATNSLFLDHIIQYCSGEFKEKTEDTSKSKKEKDNASMATPKALYKENSIELLNESDHESEPKRHSVGSRADVSNRNVSALVKSKSVSSRTSAAVSKVTKSSKFFSLFETESDSLIRCSLVMQNKDGNQWNWEIIRTILKEHDTPILNLNDSGHKAWAARVISYLRPSSNKYSHGELSAAGHGHTAARAACQLIRRLLSRNDADSQRLLEDLFSDVSKQIVSIDTGRAAHECLFSPQHMSNTMCQTYFLFVGQLCHSRAGLRLLHQSTLYRNLLELSTKTHHSCYVKLVISSLDYTIDSYPRDILAKTLTCNNQASRLYTTRFLNVLLRASQKSRELVRKKMKLRKSGLQDQAKSSKDEPGVDMDTWILQMLVGQIKDESKEVVKCALTILEEACSVSTYLDKLIAMKDVVGKNCRLDRDTDPYSIDFSVAGDRGYLLWLHLEVSSLGDNPDAQGAEFLNRHMDYWDKFYNYRYVRLVESMIHRALTLWGSRGAERPSAPPPPHLHAAPAARPRPATLQILKEGRCGSEQEIMELKAALWACGNTARTAQGFNNLMQLSSGGPGESVPVLTVRLAQHSSVYSVRATALYALGLLGGTRAGADSLLQLGWLCVRHTRHDQFPIIEEENYPTNNGSGNLHHLITSPGRRYVPRFDPDHTISEHSDQSIAESLHSDQTKHSNKYTDRKDHDTVDARYREIDKRKSHTLPMQGYSNAHEKVLTESRTLDILRDYSSYERPVDSRLVGRINSLDHHHEGRVRNTSESSTSGVSSCDSVLGIRYVFPDRVLTLSPIPSSSSLYGLKGTSQRRPDRRPSTASFTAPDAASSPPSQKDMVGYATLKSLNRSRRPHLSESAATGAGDIEELSWMLEPSRRSKPFSSLRDRGKVIKERMAKLSLLEYDWKPISSTDTGSSRQSPPPRAERRPARVQAPGEHTCYIGVCLPANIVDLFPRGESEDSMLDSFAADSSFLLDAGKHAEPTQTYPHSKEGSECGPRSWRHSASGCVACARPRPASTHELRLAFFNPVGSPGVSLEAPRSPPPERPAPHAELLAHAHYMANPIHHRQARPALISLKQRHPEVFRNPCVYSDVCQLLATGTYMMCARRFLQELFLEVSFDCFKQEPPEILARYKTPPAVV